MEYKCDVCKKDRKFSSYQSLWNHKKNFHKPVVVQEESSSSEEEQFTCSFCNKNYSKKFNLTRHQEKCKAKNENEKNKQFDEIKKQLDNIENLLKKLVNKK
jgi:hypothetical protein